MRRSVVLLAAALISLAPAIAFSQPSPGTTAQPPAVAKKPAAKKTAPPALAADQFASETEAKQKCGTDTVVWLNISSKVYHSAGTKDYGKTKRGAYMCQANADRVGRAVKAKAKANEKAKPKDKT
jgi:hypothetical protein